MSAVRVDLSIEQGADWAGVSVPILDANNTPFDVSNCTAHGQIKLLPGDPSAVFTWSNTPTAGQGKITLSGTNVSWRVLGTESEPWTFTIAQYQIELTNPSAPIGDRVIRVAQGKVLLDPDLDRT